ncbi:hypothetical protein KC19_10G172500 [Ceratodon purpureus]|uniref:Aldehyde oxidase n=2 Tax=Ceratodon purpureus TaxID=3225 RepID=A0A8T0GMT2_CERPU|nr:hypothetical protein KC19_10G172500 [Ceratodon purpureus]KAG0560331.1 hypothetical protein KC19_10G172500 [Ceratodon purpureus]
MGAPSSLNAVHRPLVFSLNGQRVELSSVDPSTTLLSYIRSETRFRGPKRGCGEGGCGACLVMLAKYNPKTKEVKESSVNSCLVMLCSIDGCAITTTEGLGNQRDGFHAIQKRLSAFHGSQCGFCTPGMTMAIYGHLKHEQQHQQKETAENGNCTNGAVAKPCSGPTSQEMERAIQGNICRCTGYRPILDVCKSFASDVDLEDLGLNTCWADKAEAKEEKLPLYDPKGDPTFPKFLIDELEARKGIQENGHARTLREEDGESLKARFTHVDSNMEGEKMRAWVSPKSLDELSAALKQLKGRKDRVKLVVGNTSSGLYKEIATIDVFVDISQIPELLTVNKNSRSLEVGAATRISELMDYLVDFRNKDGTGNVVAEGLVDHAKKLAGGHVRNWGSVGGNLVMAQKFAFESDLATILLGAGALVKVVTLTEGSEPSVAEMPLDDFLAKGTLNEDGLLQSVYIPLISDSKTDSKIVFKSYRGAPRPYGNAVSYGNAAFLANVSRNEKDETVIESVRLAFGAFGTNHAIRAFKVEELLKGKALSLSLIKESVALLKKEVVPLEGTSKKDYRVSLLVGFIFDFLNSLLSKEPTVTPTNLFPHTGKQNITIADDNYPLSQPTAKFLSQQQASGEATYCDDIPSPPRCLYAAFVLSTEPHARIKGIDATAALESVGAVDFVSLNDIPKGGGNKGIFNAFDHSEETLFAEDIVGYVGQPLGVMVADTYDHARLAAGRVCVDYDTHSVGAPVMNCHDALAQGSTLPTYPPSPLSVKHPIGNVEKALAEAEFNLEGTVSTKSQNHFYMETQTSLAIPDEDECITIYTACQGVDPVQQSVAKCLNLPLNNVRIITRRLGGGFGGKATRNIQISTAVALAAYKLRRPVRISLDRNTDMQMVGGRNPTETSYRVSFTKSGKITALKADILLESGWYADVTNFLPLLMSGTLKKYNWGTFDVKYTICKTNNVPKTSVRGPGHCEASAIADAVMNHVASYLGISGNKVRDENLHTPESFQLFQGEGSGDVGFTLPAIWERAKALSKLEEREKQIETFNEQSKWLKRGISIVPSVYGVSSYPMTATVSIFKDGSIVVEVGGVEMGQGLYTKVRQAVAFSLRSLWNKGKDVDMVSKIRVLQQDSFSLPNTFADGGSTTSESSCAAASQACEVLVQRLQPVKEKLAKDKGGEVTWADLCMTVRSWFYTPGVHSRTLRCNFFVTIILCYV